MEKTLRDVVAQRPFPDFAEWWPMGVDFLSFMSRAIVAEWLALPGNSGSLQPVTAHAADYLQVVFGRQAAPMLVENFVGRLWQTAVPQSGEFDALSYAFFRAAFEQIAAHPEHYLESVARERRLFTKRVGRRFFAQLHDHLALDLPTGLDTSAHFGQLQASIAKVGAFLQAQGYLRDHFAFTFNVNLTHAGQAIDQSDGTFLAVLQQATGYALYEMGYPVILPSAVYLYHTIGEAQHHSSRTIEELFDRVGYEARETDDFDPIGYPSERVVELWEIKKL